MKHVVNISGGMVSFFTAERVIETHGRDDVTLLFADVLMEDEDLYRFLDESSDYLGVPITRICVGLNPWELFEKEGMIGNSRSPLCSVKLKREPLDLWRRQHCMELDTTIYVGLDWTETHRLDALRAARPTWRIEAPMTEPPYMDRCQMLARLKTLGIRPPRLYLEGFPHNNCGGFCVKAGQAQFALLWRTNLQRYLYHEAMEEKVRAKVGDFSVLTDRRGDGKKKPLTLRKFRLRLESGESFDRHDWGGCGCAVDS